MTEFVTARENGMILRQCVARDGSRVFLSVFFFGGNALDSWFVLLAVAELKLDHYQWSSCAAQFNDQREKLITCQ